MRNILLICTVLVLISCSNEKTDKVIDKNFKQLLEQRNYFKLNDLLDKNGHKLALAQQLYYKAYTASAFGEKEQSNTFINRLLEEYKDKFNDTITADLLNLKATNYLYSYNYKRASEIYSEILNQYHNVLDSVETSDYQNSKVLFQTLSSTKPQIIHEHGTVDIASYKNKLKHIMIPVKTKGVLNDFVFDTGANLSTISESQAETMGMEIVASTIELGSSTQIKMDSKLAVADSLYVGSILFENVVFLVLPDEQLSFPEIEYQINGIIGFPVILDITV